MRKLVVMMMVLLAMVGCRLAPNVAPLASAPSGPQVAAIAPQDLTLRGRVIFSLPSAEQRSTQASMGDVAVNATVSLINTGTNKTEATAVTNASGSFDLTLTGFTPDPTTTYFLEAVKGLGSNQPSNPVARVRTVAKYASGWTTLTNLIPNQGIIISPGTTAISIAAALLGATNYAPLIGMLSTGATETYTPPGGANLPGAADFAAALSLVNQALSANKDPVANMGLSLPNTWVMLNQQFGVTGCSPASGSIGSTVTITGSGFDTTPANNLVKFNGTPAVVSAATVGSLTTTVPSGATSGQLAVQVGSLVALGPNFSVAVGITGFTPSSGSAGTSVVLSGAGFDTSVLSNNAVSFGGVSATVTAVSTSSLTATVPTGAISGPISVTVGGYTVTTGSSFTVPVVVSAFTPSAGNAGTSVTISGSGFSSTPANNVVTFNGVQATVGSATDTSLTVTAPAGGTTGLISVTVAGQTGSSATNFNYGTPIVYKLSPELALTGNTLTLEMGYFGSTATVNFPGGVTAAATLLGSNRAQVTVPGGATAGDLTVTTNGMTSPAMTWRRAPFSVGLQAFSPNFEQTQRARFSALSTARYSYASAMIANTLFVFGGTDGTSALNSIEQAAVNADGGLGDFAAAGTLNANRNKAAAVVIGNYLYVIGGCNSTNGSAALGTIEQATITNGNLGSFTTLGSSLNVARSGHAAMIVGGYLYVVGGHDGSGAIGSVERAVINPDGTIGAFSLVTGSPLLAPRYDHVGLVSGNTLYVLGGSNGASSLNTIEQATISADGTIGSFTTVGGMNLNTARSGAGCVVMGSSLYLIGGSNGGTTLSSVEQATLNADGTINGAGFSLGGVSLAGARAGIQAVVCGNYCYVVGGNNAGALSTVERASLNSSGGLGAFASSAVSLGTRRDGCASVVLGDTLYVIGGRDGTTEHTTVEKATINPDGTLGAFSDAGISLNVKRYGHAVAVVGNTLYVLGGTSGGSSTNNALNSIEQATITGNVLGNFTTAGVSMSSNRHGHVAVVTGSYLYVMGGMSKVGSTYLSSIERAAITGSSIGSFNSVGQTLTMARAYPGMAVIGDKLFLIGGRGSAELSSVEGATITGGTLGSFGVTAGVTLRAAKNSMVCAVVGNTLYVMGGLNGTTSTTAVETSTVNPGANTLSNFSSSALSLGSARSAHDCVVSGSNLYIIGGRSGSTSMRTIERAPLQ